MNKHIDFPLKLNVAGKTPLRCITSNLICVLRGKKADQKKPKRDKIFIMNDEDRAQPGFWISSNQRR